MLFIIIINMLFWLLWQPNELLPTSVFACACPALPQLSTTSPSSFLWAFDLRTIFNDAFDCLVSDSTLHFIFFAGRTSHKIRCIIHINDVTKNERIEKRKIILEIYLDIFPSLFSLERKRKFIECKCEYTYLIGIRSTFFFVCIVWAKACCCSSKTQIYSWQGARMCLYACKLGNESAAAFHSALMYSALIFSLLPSTSYMHRYVCQNEYHNSQRERDRRLHSTVYYQRYKYEHEIHWILAVVVVVVVVDDEEKNNNTFFWCIYML